MRYMENDKDVTSTSAVSSAGSACMYTGICGCDVGEYCSNADDKDAGVRYLHLAIGVSAGIVVVLIFFLAVYLHKRDKHSSFVDDEEVKTYN